MSKINALLANPGLAVTQDHQSNHRPYRIGRFYFDYPQAIDLNGTLYFAAFNDDKRQLWRIDNTTGGADLVVEFTAQNYFDDFILNLTGVEGTLYFLFNDYSSEGFWWKLDKNTSNAVRIDNINPTSSLYPYLLSSIKLNVNGTLYFVGDDNIHGREL